MTPQEKQKRKVEAQKAFIKRSIDFLDLEAKTSRKPNPNNQHFRPGPPRKVPKPKPAPLAEAKTPEKLPPMPAASDPPKPKAAHKNKRKKRGR